jgi:hypothetical protein
LDWGKSLVLWTRPLCGSSSEMAHRHLPNFALVPCFATILHKKPIKDFENLWQRIPSLQQCPSDAVSGDVDRTAILELTKERRMLEEFLLVLEARVARQMDCVRISRLQEITAKQIPPIRSPRQMILRLVRYCWQEND